MADALFLSLSSHLHDPRAAPKGGVQVATGEYLDVIRCAGLAPDIVPIDVDWSLGARVRRRIGGSPYRNVFDESDVLRAVAANRNSLKFVFLNTESLAQLAARIRGVAEHRTRVVLLSIGPFLGELPLEHRLQQFLGEWGLIRPPEARLHSGASSVMKLPFANLSTSWSASPQPTRRSRVG